MTGRHAITREAALNTVNTPAGRGLIAAMAVGTAFGVTMPAANAAEGTADLKDAAVLTVKSDAADSAAAATSTEAVTTAKDVEWQPSSDSVKSDNAVEVEAQVEIEEPEPVVEETAEAEDTTGADVAETATATAETAAADTTATSSESATSTSTTTSSVSGSASSVVATAKSYTGVPYVWGGTTPSGWDCIGFVRYVYAQHGVSIGGYTSSVLSVGTVVPYSEAQAGDILYWPGHVAISLGNGQNIGAWNASMGTTVGPDSWVGGTPTVIRVF